MNDYTGKAERLLRLISLFQHRRGLTAAEIMHELGIKRRSVYRYTNTLSQLGIPVYYDKQVGKHVLLDTGSATLSHLTKSESDFLTEVIQQSTVNTVSSYRERISTILSKLNLDYSPIFDDSNLDHKEGMNLANILTALEQLKTLLITTCDNRQLRFVRPALAYDEQWVLIDRTGTSRHKVPIAEIVTVTVIHTPRRKSRKL